MVPSKEQAGGLKAWVAFAEFLLRLVSLCSTLAATVTMFLNKEITNFGGYEIHASYRLSSAFKFFVVGNAVAAGYSLVGLLFICRRSKWFVHFVADLAAMALVMASASAASSIALVGKFGNDAIGWTKVCDYYLKFCSTAEVSLALSYLGFFALFLLCSLSHFKRTTEKRVTVVESP